MTNAGHSRPWVAPTATARIDARMQLPGSKSLTARALILSSLASGASTLHRPLRSRDSSIMIDGLRALGIGIDETVGDGAFGPDLVVEPGAIAGGVEIDCGLAGTAMRFLPVIAALGDGPVVFDGDEAARRRPMGAVIEALRSLGVRVEGDGLPFTVHGAGGVTSGDVEIGSGASSQFISALLLAGAKFDQGLTLRHTGSRLPSEPHIAMTLDGLARRGVNARALDERSWRVEPGEVAPFDELIEPDLSNAAPFLAAVVAVGGRLLIDGWPSETTQVGGTLPGLLGPLGLQSLKADGTLIAEAIGGAIPGALLDMHESGELAPTFAALGALATSAVEITGIGHIRGHETDRLSALATNITGLGGSVALHDDGIRVEPSQLAPGPWLAFGDHRIATAGAVIGLRIPGIEVDDIGATAKTIPEFPQLWAAMLGGGQG